MAKGPMNQHKSMAMGTPPKQKPGSSPAFAKGGAVKTAGAKAPKMASKGVPVKGMC